MVSVAVIAVVAFGENYLPLHIGVPGLAEICSVLMIETGSSREIRPRVNLRGNLWQGSTRCVQGQTMDLGSTLVDLKLHWISPLTILF